MEKMFLRQLSRKNKSDTHWLAIVILLNASRLSPLTNLYHSL